MRIGINASFARKGNTGLGQVALNFLDELIRLQNMSARTKDQFFLYLEEDLPQGVELPENIQKRVFLPLWKRDDLIRKLWWEKYLLPRKVKKDRCDVFVSLYQSATVLPEKIRHLMVVHDIIPEHYPEYLNNSRKRHYYAQVRKAVSKAERIISISRWTEKDLIRSWGLDPQRISVAYLGAAEIYRRRASAAAEKKALERYDLQPGYIYAAGGLEKRKNIETLIRSYKRLRELNETENFPDHFPPLVIAGELQPQLAPLVLDAEKLVRELNLTQSVRLIGRVEQAHMPALYAAAALFVYPSLFEGFGLPVLEAMSQGVPVVASKRTAIPEVGLDSILYFDPEDGRDLDMVLRNVLIHADLRETLKKRSIERARQFSWKKFVTRVLNIAGETGVTA